MSRLGRAWPLALGLLVIVFPFGWLGEIWPAFGVALGSIFRGLWGHMAGHFLLFFMVGIVLLQSLPWLRTHFRDYLLLALGVGLVQELIQLAYKQRPVLVDDVRDVLVDLIGAGVAFGIDHWLHHRRKTRLGKKS